MSKLRVVSLLAAIVSLGILAPLARAQSRIAPGTASPSRGIEASGILDTSQDALNNVTVTAANLSHRQDQPRVGNHRRSGQR